MGYTLHRKRNKQNKKGETIKKQTLFLWVNIIGGIAVLGGYAYALAINPETRNALWGGIPESWKPLYTFSMFTSAIGYLYATYYLVFKGGLDLQFFWGKYKASLLTILISIFLISSSFWIHSTFSYIDSPTQSQWLTIQIELFITAIALILFTIGLVSANGVGKILNHKLAIIGCLLITFHCLILDAIIWTSKFPKDHLP